MKKLLALASMALLLSASASFAKQAMDEEEMDLVTAAGQPAVIIVDTGTGTDIITVSADEMGTTTLNVDTNSQTNLRAIALNNVAGENQVANAVNIRSGQTSGDGDQTNVINQSWGSSYDWSFAPGATATATATATGGANSVTKVVCVLAECNVGNAAAEADAAAAQAVPLTIHADKIIAINAGDGANTVDVSQVNMGTYTANIDTGSQVNLAGISVNNVAGINQVANAMNLAANGSVQVGVGSDAAIKLDANVAGTAQYSGNQSNTINQYRGTPLNRVP